MEHTDALPAQSGVHLVEWACEFAGTAALLVGGLSAVCFDFGPGTPLHAVPHSARLLITGLLFAGTGSLIAISPPGRRSGAHINPVVTLAFWTQRKVHPHDVFGYVIAQCTGAILGAAIVRLLWQHKASVLDVGATTPGRGLSDPEAALVEALMTAILIITILFMTSSARTARWTPLVLWLVIATLVWQGAPYTGTSLNPARSLGPALVAPLWSHFEVYVAGPLLGGAVAVAVFAAFRDRHVLTAKLFHDPAYPSTLATSLPTAPGPDAARRLSGSAG
ncbi:MAG TPA: aquaporin [Mycobacteriales bacterium]|nr:aquaporin [Mycobacteriales bacterium]